MRMSVYNTFRDLSHLRINPIWDDLSTHILSLDPDGQLVDVYLYQLITLPWSRDYCKSTNPITRLTELWYNIIYSPEVVAIYDIQQQATYIKQTHKETEEVIYTAYDDSGIHIIQPDAEPVSNWLTATIEKSMCPHNIRFSEFETATIGNTKISRHYFLYRQFHITCIRLFERLGLEYSHSLHRSSHCNCIEHQTLTGFKLWMRKVETMNLNDLVYDDDYKYPWADIFQEIVLSMLLQKNPPNAKLLEVIEDLRQSGVSFLADFRHSLESRLNITMLDNPNVMNYIP